MAAFTPTTAGSATLFVKSKGRLEISTQLIGLTESALVVPAGVVAYSIAFDQHAQVWWGTVVGATSGTEYWIQYPGQDWTEQLLTGDSITLYVRSTQASTRLRLRFWYQS